MLMTMTLIVTFDGTRSIILPNCK